MPKNNDIIYDTIISDDNTYRSVMPEVAAYLSSLIVSDEFKTAAGEDGERVSKDLSMLFIKFEDSYGATELDEIAAGFRNSESIAAVLKFRNKDGISYAEALMNAAIARDKTPERLCESLYYMNEKLNMGLELGVLLPGSVRPKKKMTGEPSWNNYMKEHMTDVPYDRKGREEYLAKAMVGAFKDYQSKKSNKTVSFSVKQARNYAEKLVKNKVFKKFCENRIKMDRFVHDMNKKPDQLYKSTVQIYRPFAFIPKGKRMEVLRRLKKMAELMDGRAGRSSKWQALKRSIEGINLNDPAACGEEKLSEIYELTCNYMKGKKSIRTRQTEKNRFDQALDVLAELSKCGEFAKYHVQTVFDRVNEVRMSKDENYRPVKMIKYGAGKLLSHTNETSIARTDEYKEWLLYPDGQPEVETVRRKAFEKYPGGDPSGLPKATGDSKDYTVLDVAIQRYRPFVSDMMLTVNGAIRNISTILGLADTNIYYYRDSGETGKSKVAVKNAELSMNTNRYLKDPAVAKLAEKYRTKDSRNALTDELGSLHSIKYEVLREQLAEIRKEMKMEVKEPAKGK